MGSRWELIKNVFHAVSWFLEGIIKDCRLAQAEGGSRTWGRERSLTEVYSSVNKHFVPSNQDKQFCSSFKRPRVEIWWICIWLCYRRTWWHGGFCLRLTGKCGLCSKLFPTMGCGDFLNLNCSSGTQGAGEAWSSHGSDCAAMFFLYSSPWLWSEVHGQGLSETCLVVLMWRKRLLAGKSYRGGQW